MSRALVYSEGYLRRHPSDNLFLCHGENEMESMTDMRTTG